jgi:hypothetical protein
MFHLTPNANFGPISDRVTFYFTSTRNLNIHFLHLQTCFFPSLFWFVFQIEGWDVGQFLFQ